MGPLGQIHPSWSPEAWNSTWLLTPKELSWSGWSSQIFHHVSELIKWSQKVMGSHLNWNNDLMTRLVASLALGAAVYCNLFYRSLHRGARRPIIPAQLAYLELEDWNNRSVKWRGSWENRNYIHYEKYLLSIILSIIKIRFMIFIREWI